MSTLRQVKTTTWPLRHEETFSQFRRYLSEMGIANPRVLEIGPGAATKLLAPYYPAAGIGESLSRPAHFMRFLIRKFDSVLRRIPGVELCSFEPGELRRYLPEEVNHHVTDISAQVITAVRNQYTQVTAKVHDFSTGPYPANVDAVVCLCVLVRAKEPKKLFHNIYESLKPGGLLAMDNRSVRSFSGPEHKLEALSNQVFRKV